MLSAQPIQAPQNAPGWAVDAIDELNAIKVMKVLFNVKGMGANAIQFGGGTAVLALFLTSGQISDFIAAAQAAFLQQANVPGTFTGTVVLAKLTTANGSLTVVNGIITSYTPTT